MRKPMKAGMALVASLAVCASLGVGTAFAGGTVNLDGTANWTIPTTAMTNTVWKDADGNVVAANTEGATQYKVLTTWAEAWSTSGPDYLGVSNSAYFGNGGNGNPKVTDSTIAQKNNTIGVWATSANQNANAYNWNMFYNLYANSEAGVAAQAQPSEWYATSTTANGGADWSTEAGVWCGFKYRPEVVWTNNNLSAKQAATYIDQIKNGQYSATATAVTEGEGRNKTTTYIPDAQDGGTYNTSFAVYGDNSYDPAIISPNNNSPYSFVVSEYQLASAAEKVIEATAENPGLGEGEVLDWKTVNKLPRSNRYSETPTEAALNIEKLAKGSVYYTLSKIADGTVDKKKVAYVCYPWSYNQNGTTTTESQVVVAVYDYTENIGNGPMDGRASWTPLTVDQLSTATKCGDKQGGSSVSDMEVSNGSSTTTFQLYYATADDLASCDVVYCSPNVGKSTAELQAWIEKYATSDSAQAAAKDISYLATWPCITNGSNYTIEKLIYGAYGLDFIYPELFPSMELSSFWCNSIYHLTDSSLASAMSWIYSTASLPTGIDISSIPASYSEDSLLAKFAQGYGYYTNCATVDPTLSRVLLNTALDGTTQINGVNYEFSSINPTDAWAQSAKASYGISGETRYDTMKTVALSTFKSAEKAVIAYGKDFPDALSASALAGALDAPVLLVSDDDSATAVSAMKTLGVKEFYVVGGTNAISDEIVSSVANASGATLAQRVYGAERADTAIEVAKLTAQLAGQGTTAIVATGSKAFDSLSVSPYAYDTKTPIYLAKEDGTLSDATAEAMKSAGYTNIIIVGGVNVVSDGVVAQAGATTSERWSGDSRYETSVEIAKKIIENDNKFSYKGVTVATGENFPDALAGSAYAANNGQVLLLAAEGQTAAQNLLQANKDSVKGVTFLGGIYALPQTTRDAIMEAID